MHSESLAIKALKCIEILAEGSGKSELLDQIYRVAHTGRAIGCRKNHPNWNKEVHELYEVFKNG